MKKLYNQVKRDKWREDEYSMPVIARYGTGGGNMPIVLQRRFSNVTVIETDVSPTIEAGGGEGGNNLPMIMDKVVEDGSMHGNGTGKCRNHEGGCPTLNNNHEQPILMSDRKGHNGITEDGKATTLTAEEKDRPLAATSIVRRLTPKETERLQGMPDDWSRWGVDEKGKTYELPDSARYKLQGNGIATPFWKYLLKRISAQYERDATLGSLFDGQASFPMLWEQINGKGSALWSSEIDKHAIAVAKYHFPEAE